MMRSMKGCHRVVRPSWRYVMVVQGIVGLTVMQFTLGVLVDHVGEMFVASHEPPTHSGRPVEARYHDVLMMPKKGASQV